MTYSQFSVRQAIGRAQDNTGHLVRLPTHVAVMVRLAKASVEYLPLNADWGLLEETVQKQAQLSLRKFEFLRNLQELPVEFDEFAFACLDAVLGVEDVLLKSRLCREVRWGLSKLKPRQERILRLRFGFGDLDEHTLEECGQTFGVTRERIRQIEAKALRLLKHPARCGKLGFLL